MKKDQEVVTAKPKQKGLVEQNISDLTSELKNPAVMRSLLATTFKGFQSEQLVKQACLEAMMNGYTFEDIVKKKVYAIPFGKGYSLVQSISDVRATAMRSGQVGKDAPEYEEDENGKIITCTVTIKKVTMGHVGDFTATVYFDEYNKGRDNWVKMPHTMIAKVAEMHALRMAFPEELSQAYIEDEFNEKNNRFGGVDMPTPDKFKKGDEKPAPEPAPKDAEVEETTTAENLIDTRNNLKK